MGLPLPCDNHAEQLAVILLTNLEEGGTATFCGECLIRWATMLIQGLEVGPEPDQAETPEVEGQPAAAFQAEQHSDGPDQTGPQEAGPQPEQQLAAAPPQETPATGN